MLTILWRKWLSFIVGLIMSILTFDRKRPDARQMQRLDFSSSTQRMGLRFTENLRDRWRRRWLKLRR